MTTETYIDRFERQLRNAFDRRLTMETTRQDEIIIEAPLRRGESATAVKGGVLIHNQTDDQWTFAGCLICRWTAHEAPGHAKPDRCPNDGTKLVRLDGSVRSVERIEAAQRLVREAIGTARLGLCPWTL